jgi:hypothetical protein
MFSHYKQFGMEINMNSWIFEQSNQLINQKSMIDNECIIFKK